MFCRVVVCFWYAQLVCGLLCLEHPVGHNRWGGTEKSGLLRGEHQSPRRDDLPIFLKVSSPGDQVTKQGSELVHEHPRFGLQRWKVLEWGFDPFAPEKLEARKDEKKLTESPKLESSDTEESAATGAELPDEALSSQKKVLEKVAELIDDIEGQKKKKKDEKEPGPDVAELPANFKFPRGYPPPESEARSSAEFPGNFKFPAGYPPPPDESVPDEEKAAAIAAVASAAVAGALPPGTTQAIVVPSAVPGAPPIVFSTYRTALEGLSPSEIAEALSTPCLSPGTLPPASALLAAAFALQQPSHPGMGPLPPPPPPWWIKAYQSAFWRGLWMTSCWTCEEDLPDRGGCGRRRRWCRILWFPKLMRASSKHVRRCNNVKYV